MYQTVTQYDFVQAFEDMDRAENFTRRARQELFEYLEDLERDTGEEIELDVIALCCEWSEYTRDELAEQYPDQYDDDEDTMVEAFEEVTHIIRVDQGRGGENTYLLLAF